MRKITNLAGQEFGRLIVISLIGRNNGRTLWLCECKCNKIRKIISASHLVSKHTQSCGCFNKEKASERNTKHGYRKNDKDTHPLYIVWINMKKRCYNPSATQYQDWGGRGIRICDEWLNNPSRFISWALENGWKPELVIDRINNNDNYSPENCRFVDYKISNNNRRKNNLGRKPKDKRC